MFRRLAIISALVSVLCVVSSPLMAQSGEDAIRLHNEADALQEKARSPSLMTPVRRDPIKDGQLLEATRKGDVSKVEELLAEGADVGCTDAEWGGTPLHWASYDGHRQVASLLLEKGADVNAKNKDGDTPLFMAAGFGHRGVVEVLLRHKADKSVKNRNGKTALDWARYEKHKDIVRLLEK